LRKSLILLEFLLIYFLARITDNGIMINKENAAQRERARLITLINAIKPAAIAAGFDYPTANPETATTYELQTATNKELQEFINEVTSFIRSYANREV